jgi:DNA-directed RNA polymerase specialized sigma24 family protein
VAGENNLTESRQLKPPEEGGDRYGGYLYRFALARIRDTEQAQEPVQETFLAALRSRQNYRRPSSPKTWMTANLKHELIAAVFMKREMEGASTQEMCQEMGITTTNYGAMRYRACHGLRRCLQPNWFDATG